MAVVSEPEAFNAQPQQSVPLAAMLLVNRVLQ